MAFPLIVAGIGFLVGLFEGGCDDEPSQPVNDTDATDAPPDTVLTDTGVPVDVIDETRNTDDTGFWDSFETQSDSGPTPTDTQPTDSSPIDTQTDTRPDTQTTQPINNDGDPYYANGYYDGSTFVDCSNPSQQLQQICRERVDCDDSRDFVFPGAKELANFLDNNCNGIKSDINHEPGGDTVMWVGETPIDTQLGGTSNEMTFGDVDGDGKLDVLIIDSLNNIICGNLGNKNNIVQGKVNQVPADCDFTITSNDGALNIGTVMAYDLDRDGKDDILFTINNFSDTTGFVGAFAGLYGRDVFQSSYTLTTALLNDKDTLKSNEWQMFRMKGSVEAPIEKVTIGQDIDNDGRPEFIFPMYGRQAKIIPADAYVGTTNVDSVLNTAGYGGYWLFDSFPYSHLDINPISTGDMNGDGHADLLVCNSDDFPESHGYCHLLDGKTIPKYPAIVDVNDFTNTPQVKHIKISGDANTFAAGGSNLMVDLDHDGFTDVIIGNGSTTAYGEYAGEAYWISGNYLRNVPGGSNIVMNDELLIHGAKKISGDTDNAGPGMLTSIADSTLIWANQGYQNQGIVVFFSAESIVNQPSNMMTLGDATLQLTCGFGDYAQGFATSYNPVMQSHILVSAPQAENQKGHVYLVPGSPL